MAFNRDYDGRVGAAAFEWLARKVSMHGDVLSRDMPASGMQFGGFTTNPLPYLGGRPSDRPSSFSPNDMIVSLKWRPESESALPKRLQAQATGPSATRRT